MKIEKNNSVNEVENASKPKLPKLGLHGISEIVDIEPNEEDKRRLEEFIRSRAKQ